MSQALKIYNSITTYSIMLHNEFDLSLSVSKAAGIDRQISYNRRRTSNRRLGKRFHSQQEPMAYGQWFQTHNALPRRLVPGIASRTIILCPHCVLLQTQELMSGRCIPMLLLLDGKNERNKLEE